MQRLNLQLVVVSETQRHEENKAGDKKRGPEVGLTRRIAPQNGEIIDLARSVSRCCYGEELRRCKLCEQGEEDLNGSCGRVGLSAPERCPECRGGRSGCRGIA